jgi:hypothetical protein
VNEIQTVKMTLAIFCSLLLAWTPIVLAQAPAAGVVRSAGACCHCHKPCCATPTSPQSQPFPAAPVPASSQNQLLTLAPAAVVWILPAAPASEFSASVASPWSANRTPLYARSCAFLI